MELVGISFIIAILLFLGFVCISLRKRIKKLKKNNAEAYAHLCDEHDKIFAEIEQLKSQNLINVTEDKKLSNFIEILRLADINNIKIDMMESVYGRFNGVEEQISLIKESLFQYSIVTDRIKKRCVVENARAIIQNSSGTLVIGSRRLFIITGIISLINAMAIIDQLEHKQENHLLIYTNSFTDSFVAINEKILLDNYFSSIQFAEGIEEVEFFFDKAILSLFDEVYITYQFIMEKYRNNFSKLYLIEEGISSYCEFSPEFTKKIEAVILNCYFDKMSYLSKNSVPVIRQSRECTLRVIDRIIEKNSIDFSYLKKDNQVLMLSQYIFENILTPQEIVDFYSKHIDKLLMRGFSILFKSHPRVEDTIIYLLKEKYEKNARFSIFDASINWPVELIVSQLNLVAIVASMSGGALTCSHLFGIPCFGFGARMMNIKNDSTNRSYINLYASIFMKILPHISLLENMDMMAYSTEEEKRRNILSVFTQYISAVESLCKK